MKLSVTFETECPDGLTDDEIDALLDWHLQANGCIDTALPEKWPNMEAQVFTVRWRRLQ